VEYFKSVGKHQEAARIKERVEYDIEMIRELGYCTGIENYSRFFDRRKPCNNTANNGHVWWG
jgi:excinuclease ABC subunit B